jgi:predicted amidohydrolase YtcJ
VTGDHPAYLVRVDGHAGWVNSKALSLAGVSAAPPTPGGRDHSVANAPSGVLVGCPGLVGAKIPPPSREVRKRWLRSASRLRPRPASPRSTTPASTSDVALYKELLAERSLPIRVYVMLRGPEGSGPVAP